MWVARALIPIWFGFAVFVLGWGQLVDHLLRPLSRWPVELPGLIVGTLPAFAAWMALWWAQYPADHALRQQNLLLMIEDGLPVHQPPGFWSYFTNNLRLQVLFSVVPVALIVLIHDLVSVALSEFAGMNLRGPDPGRGAAQIELFVQLSAVALVVLFSSEVLRRILHTERLPDSPLRSRLEELCRRTNLQYRDILLWRTDNNLGNAAVMGLFPRVRYILLSDVLIETMSEREIEAVFAHEIGHVKHWHMGWYIVLFATVILMCAGPIQMFADHAKFAQPPSWLTDDVTQLFSVLVSLGGFAVFFSVFGYLSRRLERQADVYAARTMQEATAMADAGPLAAARILNYSPFSHVGPHGASLFNSALRRVAIVNNIPLDVRRRPRHGLIGRIGGTISNLIDLSNNFLHGSISQRMRYLENLSVNPSATLEFDRSMSVLYSVLLTALAICTTWVLVSWVA
jgi:STE24 endopeptidase